MARKKKSDDDLPDEDIVSPTADASVDPFVQSQIENLAKLTKGTVRGQAAANAESAVIALPFREPSKRYLFGNSGFAIGRMTELVGPTASCKSAFLYEIYNWHVAAGGLYKHILAEPRDSKDLRMSILRGKAPDVVIPARYLNDWTAATMATLHTYEKLFKKSMYGNSDSGRLMVDGVDSLTAVTTRKAAEELYETGDPNPGFSPIARAITDWARVYFTHMASYPISFVGVNHHKSKPNSQGLPTKTIPGGDQLGYASTTVLKFRVKKVGELTGGVGYRQVEIETLKNSLSAAGEPRSLDVFLTWHVDQETGAQYSWWDWNRATIELLLSFSPDSKIGRLINELVYIEGNDKTNRTASCKQYGLKKASYDEIGEAINNDTQLVSGLDAIFGVRVRHAWRNGVPYDQQLRDAVANPISQHASAEGEEGAEADV